MSFYCFNVQDKIRATFLYFGGASELWFLWSIWRVDHDVFLCSRYWSASRDLRSRVHLNSRSNVAPSLKRDVNIDIQSEDETSTKVVKNRITSRGLRTSPHAEIIYLFGRRLACIPPGRIKYTEVLVKKNFLL